MQAGCHGHDCPSSADAVSLSSVCLALLMLLRRRAVLVQPNVRATRFMEQQPVLVGSSDAIFKR